MIAHLTADQLARGVTAAALAFLGILQILRPACLWGMGVYFAGARAAFSPDQRERLARVLAARSEAEGDTDAFTRYAGFFTLAMAAVALVPSVPYVLPYAASCSATAVAILCIYLHFRRATTRRVAPLVHRTPWTSLSPLALVTVAVCILGAAAFATLPQYRVGGIIVVVTAVALCAIAWRVAISPAILFGDDPQLEYLVDEHVRFCRATSLAALACAPPTVLVLLAGAALRPDVRFFDVVSAVVLAAFVVAMVVSLNPLRKRLALA